ncbi:MAG: ion transporter [Bacteroides sp.]|uniref:ion transporter n=1 Tax=Bacteroides sp. TaxID=29523 RepID=UPI002FC81D23
MAILQKNNISFFDITICILSFYVLAVMLIQLFIPMSPDMEELLWMIDTCICAVFIADFIINFIKAPNKLSYLKYGIIDLIASIPNIGALRFGRIAKIIRVFRIIKSAKSINSILTHTFKNKGEGIFKSVLLSSILLVIVSAMLILIFEKGNNEIDSASDAFWWTIYTLLGMDYCSPPISFYGKAIATILAISGMSLLGTFTAYLAEIFFNNNNIKK